MNSVVLLIGGNMGNRLNTIQMAVSLLKQKNVITKNSSIWESEAWGFSSKDNFLNQVICIETNDKPLQILDKIQSIENILGRKRKEKQWISRIIDIDVLFFNDEIIGYDRLIIPHAQIKNRKFTLCPLNEILPNYIHPVFKKSINELLNECTDQGKVWKLNQ